MCDWAGFTVGYSWIPCTVLPLCYLNAAISIGPPVSVLFSSDWINQHTPCLKYSSCFFSFPVPVADIDQTARSSTSNHFLSFKKNRKGNSVLLVIQKSIKSDPNMQFCNALLPNFQTLSFTLCLLICDMCVLFLYLICILLDEHLLDWSTCLMLTKLGHLIYLWCRWFIYGSCSHCLACHTQFFKYASLIKWLISSCAFISNHNQVCCKHLRWHSKPETEIGCYYLKRKGLTCYLLYLVLFYQQ